MQQITSGHKPVITKRKITLNFKLKIFQANKINIERLTDPNIESEYKNYALYNVIKKSKT